MTQRFAWILGAAAALAAGAGLRAQQAPDSGFATSTTAVVVDVVVRDAKGAPVLDLKPSDFELLEDDRRQKITSVELIAPGRTRTVTAATKGSTTAPPAPGTPPSTTGTSGGTPTADPTLIALVFHRLDGNSRALAYRAARSYVDGDIAENDLAGVFIVDTGLETVQTFTSDRAKLADAIEKAARTATSTFRRQVPVTSSFGDRHPDVSPTASAEDHGRPPDESGFQPRKRRRDMSQDEIINRKIQDMAERMENAYQEMMHDRNGHAETAALTALASSLGQLPGRKTVVFFSEGLAIPAAVETKFRAVIETANRANVSFYTVNAKGLDVHSEQAKTARGIAALRGVGDDDPLDVVEKDKVRPKTKDLERNEFLLRQDPAASLGMLAKETGGFLIDNTNDLASAFKRIDDDRRFHYLLTYSPSNTAQDGSFRKIAVKVKRKDVAVFARSGYVAMPTLGSIPVLRFESNALSALARTPRPTEIQLRAATFAFPEADGGTRIALFVDVPGSGVAYFVDDNRTYYQTHFTILARILDDDGDTIRKGSQPYRLKGAADDVHVARQGDIVFYRQPTLDPGRYTLEYALYDELSGQAGTGTMPVEVPTRSPSALAMSDLVLIARAEAVPDDQRDATNPLYLGSTLIYPNLGTPVARSKRGTLVFYYTARAGGRPLAGRVELRQDGRAVASKDLVVPAADATGRVQHAAEIGLDGVGPGPYELRVTLQDGASSATRSTAFELQP
jgi:VWFA-related protein